MNDSWQEVDAYLAETLMIEDDALRAASEAAAGTTMPHAAVSPVQGRLLALLAQMCGARRVLEFGTLAGYSCICLARAVGPQGQVTTLELDAGNADIARANLERAGVLDRVEILVGPAAQSAQRLVAVGTAPYDFVFIDADKPNNAAYLGLSLQLSRPGTVIVVDNVVRGGAVIDAESPDPRTQGARAVLADMAADPRLSATALQTVGMKGWDGLAIIRRTS